MDGGVLLGFSLGRSAQFVDWTAGVLHRKCGVRGG